MRRRMLPMALAVALGAAAVAPAEAVAQAAAVNPEQGYPSRPIKIVVAYPAGGPNDIVARIYGQRLSELLGQPVIIENRTGAGGVIGTQEVAKSPPDGYTLLAGAGALTIAPALDKKLGYSVIDDFAPIGLMARGAFILAANPSVPAQTVRELIAYAKANPRKLKYGSSGVGAPPHLAAELLKSMAHIDMIHVPYRGVSQAVNDLISGQIDIMFTSLPVALPHVSTGKLKALAVSTAKRSPLASDIVSLDEAGPKGFEIATWWGLLAPAGTPSAMVERLSRALASIGNDPDAAKVLAAQGLDVITSTPEAFSAHIKSEIEIFAKIAQAAGIAAN